jgi:D-alanyl-lipoteichoic acid acyltransferase DltB (MBOAT superfamily)
MPPEKHPGIFASCFLFFPKIVQGPIERAGRVLPQFHAKHDPDPEGIKEGLILMTWGFFKKLVIADNLAIIVTAVFVIMVQRLYLFTHSYI